MRIATKKVERADKNDSGSFFTKFMKKKLTEKIFIFSGKKQRAMDIWRGIKVVGLNNGGEACEWEELIRR